MLYVQPRLRIVLAAGSTGQPPPEAQGVRMFFGAVDYQPLQAGLDDGSWLWRTSRPDPALFRLNGPGEACLLVECRTHVGNDIWPVHSGSPARYVLTCQPVTCALVHLSVTILRACRPFSAQHLELRVQ